MHFLAINISSKSIYIIVALKSFQLVPSVLGRAMNFRAVHQGQKHRTRERSVGCQILEPSRDLFDFFCVGGLSCSVKLRNAVYSVLETVS